MRKGFCIIVILASIVTMISTLRSDNDVSNETVKMSKVYIWQGTIWKRQMAAADVEGGLSTLVKLRAEQIEYVHELSAEAAFVSTYEYARLIGTYHLKAKLNHAWATDEEPYEERGQIKGKKGGMTRSGDQNDRDWFAMRDTRSIWECEAYAEAKVYHPTENKHYKAVAEAPFYYDSSIWLRKIPGDNSPDVPDDVIPFPDLTPDDGDTPAPPAYPEPPDYNIWLADSDQIPEPGDSVTLNLVTSEPYYDVSWYVHTPWDTSSSGTYQDYAYGDGTSTETSFTYTFPSGAMHTGDFLFRAVIHRSSDMSSYEETYTVTVPSATTVPDRPGSFNLTPGYRTIQLSWTSSASDGGSPITAYEFQYQSSSNGRRTWSSWSEWTSGGTDNFHLITGLSRNTDYGVRMRAKNNEGASVITGIRIVRTRE